MTNSSKLSRPTKSSAYLSLGLGILALTLSPLFIRWADAPGVITAFYRMLIASVILAPFALRDLWKIRERLSFRILAFPLAAGIFSAMDHYLWATAINKTTVANATLLNNISPLWVSLIAVLIFRERLGLRFWIGLVGILAGASAVLGSTVFLKPDLVSGDVYAITSSLFYGGYYLLTQKGRDRLDAIPTLWLTTTMNAFLLLAISQLQKIPLTGYSKPTIIIFFAAALIAQLGAYNFITYSLGKLPASVVTPSMVAQPVLTALLAIPFAGEKLMPWQIIGGLITIGGIYLVNTAKRKKKIDPMVDFLN